LVSYVKYTKYIQCQHSHITTSSTCQCGNRLLRQRQMEKSRQTLFMQTI